AGTISVWSMSPVTRRPPGLILIASACGSTSTPLEPRLIRSGTSKNTPARKSARAERTRPPGRFMGGRQEMSAVRLFPNPDFDEAAAKKWDPVRYYTDPSYYESKDLIRPYRVGMSCAFCHVGPNPLKPPTDPENPKWENLSSNVGAQYFWVDRIFSW